jgi:hypothetical protein
MNLIEIMDDLIAENSGIKESADLFGKTLAHLIFEKTGSKECIQLSEDQFGAFMGTAYAIGVEHTRKVFHQIIEEIPDEKV